LYIRNTLRYRSGAKRRPRQSRRPSAAKSIIRAEITKDTGPITYLGFFSAAATRNGFKDLYLFAGTGVLDNMADVDDAISAGVGAMATPLSNVHADGQDVLAVLPATQEVGAVAGLFAVVDRVESPTRAAGHEVEVLTDAADLVAAGAVAGRQGPARTRLRR
jgi:hypothetical protein